MTKEKRCHPELVSGSHYSIYPLVFVREIYEMLKTSSAWQFGVGSVGQEGRKIYEMLKTSSAWQFNISSACSSQGRGKTVRRCRHARGELSRRRPPTTQALILGLSAFSPSPDAHASPSPLKGGGKIGMTKNCRGTWQFSAGSAWQKLTCHVWALSKSQAEMFPARHIVSNVRKGKYLILHKEKPRLAQKRG